MFSFFWTRRTSPWASILYFLLGLILTIFPGMSGRLFCTGLSIVTGIFAVISFVRLYQRKKLGEPMVGTGAGGLVFLAICLFCAFWPETVLSILPVFLGVLLILDGAGKLPLAIEAVRSKDRLSWSMLVAALLPLILGVVIVANPFGAVKLVIRVFGISLLIDGVFDLAAALGSRK